jgi:ureidoglycolate hydrolase
MRAITKDAFDAFTSNTDWSRDNTRVENNNTTTDMYLFGNKIATKENASGIVQISDGDHAMTVTTKERLKPFASVYTKKGQVYCDGMQWDGGWIVIGSGWGP